MNHQNYIEESARQLPVYGKYDVVVVGGGIAGVAAAIAAARRSARVCLVERYCAVGGLATLGNVTMWLPICDGRGHQVIAGLGEELLRLSVAQLQTDYPAARFTRVPECWEAEGDLRERTAKRYAADFNPAAYMLALEEILIESGVELFYDTRFCDVRREGTRITHVIVENKSGRSALAGSVFIDATGDADVCVCSGEETVSLESNVITGWFYTLTQGELKLHKLSKKYSPIAGTENAEGPFFRGDDAEHVTKHILQTRALLRNRLAEFRASHLPQDTQVLMPAMIACFRMTRRLAGGFTLAGSHMHQWFDDTIGLTGDWRQPGPVFAIPFRCLQAMRNSNLLVAGRCISVDNTAWDVLRAIPPCVVTGEAAGTAAALAASHAHGDIRMIDFGALKKQLCAQGVLLDPTLVCRT
ncbi:MAG: FAD-dependent oxidoreductase [Kiritimatiellales bacterium]